MKTKLTRDDLIVKKYFERYKMLLARKKHLEKRLDRTVFNMPQGLSSIDYSKPYVTGGKYNDAPTQISDMLKIQEQIEEVNSDIQEVLDTIASVNDVANDDMHSKVLTYLFIDELSVEQISMRVDKSIWTIYKKRKDAIKYLSFIVEHDIVLDDEDTKEEDVEAEI